MKKMGINDVKIGEKKGAICPACGEKQLEEYLMRVKPIEEHLKRVSLEAEKLLQEFNQRPDTVGLIEHRLFWVVRGVDPHKAICCKHNKKIIQNNYGESICEDCMDDLVTNKIFIDENNWYDPDDKPPVRIYGM